MRKAIITSSDGTHLPCIYEGLNKKKLAIVTHFFGESKDSDLNKSVYQVLKDSGYGFISFDMRGHGDQEDDGSSLEFETFCQDVFAAEEYILSKDPPVEKIVYIGEGLSALMLLWYLSLKSRAGRDAILINPDLDLFTPLSKKISDEQMESLEKNGYIAADIGGREFIASEYLMDDISFLDMLGLYRAGSADITMILSSDDDFICRQSYDRFAAVCFADILEVSSSDHLLKDCNTEEFSSALSSALS